MHVDAWPSAEEGFVVVWVQPAGRDVRCRIQCGLREVTLSGILILVCGVSAVHLSTLSWLSAYTWGYKKSGLIAPKRILLSRPHLLGVAAATTGVLVFATTALTNSLQTELR